MKLVKAFWHTLFVVIAVPAIAWIAWRYRAGIAATLAMIMAGVAVERTVFLLRSRHDIPAKERLQWLLLILILLGTVWSAYRYPIIRTVFQGASAAAVLVLTAAVYVTVLVAFGDEMNAKVKEVEEEFQRADRTRKRRLAELLSEDESVREQAVTSLSEDLATVDDLAAAYARERSARVRRVIVETLHAMSRQYLGRDEYRRSHPSRGAPLTLDLPGYDYILEKYVMPPLISALQSSDREEREAALMALLWPFRDVSG